MLQVHVDYKINTDLFTATLIGSNLLAKYNEIIGVCTKYVQVALYSMQIKAITSLKPPIRYYYSSYLSLVLMKKIQGQASHFSSF